MLNIDVQHKFLRNDTVYHEIRRLINDRKSFKDELLGAVVISIHNDKTYKIDDIDENQSPMSSFTTRKVRSLFVNSRKMSWVPRRPSL